MPRLNKTQTRVVLVIAVALLVLLGVLASRPQPLDVETGLVDRGAVEVTVREEGESRVLERYVVSAPVRGRVLRSDLDPGDPVVAGETALARLLPSDPILLDVRTRAQAEAAVAAAEATLGGARAELERSRSQLKLARSELSRQLRLADAGIVAQDQLELAQTTATTQEEAVRAAEFAVRSATGELRRARAALQAASLDAESGETIALRSPSDGVVLAVVQESEAVVEAGAPLVEVGDPTQIEIVVDYLSADAAVMEPGQQVRIEEWGGAPLAGRVRVVEPSGFTRISALGVEEQRVNVRIDLLELPSQGLLGDGFRTLATVILWRAEDTLRVPTSALYRRDDAWRCYRVEGGVAAEVEVQVGHRGISHAEVLGGLEAGDRVVAHPPMALEDGSRVRFPGGDSAPPRDANG